MTSYLRAPTRGQRAAAVAQIAAAVAAQEASDRHDWAAWDRWHTETERLRCITAALWRPDGGQQ